MQINNMADVPYALAYDERFLMMVENHYSFLISLPPTFYAVTAAQNISNIGDFFGLLNDLGIEKKYHQITLEFNGYRHPADYCVDVMTVSLPNTNLIDELLALIRVN